MFKAHHLIFFLFIPIKMICRMRRVAYILIYRHTPKNPYLGAETLLDYPNYMSKS